MDSLFVVRESRSRYWRKKRAIITKGMRVWTNTLVLMWLNHSDCFFKFFTENDVVGKPCPIGMGPSGLRLTVVVTCVVH